jgi:hypothetical protein
MNIYKNKEQHTHIQGVPGGMCHYLRNRSTLDLSVLDIISIL